MDTAAAATKRFYADFSDIFKVKVRDSHNGHVCIATFSIAYNGIQDALEYVDKKNENRGTKPWITNT